MKSKFQNMVFVKGGKYTPCFTDDEKEVFDLEVCKYQTTQKLWLEIMGINPSQIKGDFKPVDSITWWEALEFCNKLSEKYNLKPVYDLSKKRMLMINQLGEEKASPDIADFKKTEGFRLPTEVEWEWFARGGQVAIDKGTFDYKYSGSNNVDEVAWYDKISNGETQNVGTKKPNQLGLYDCSGNIWEMCYDTAEDEFLPDGDLYIYEDTDSTIPTRRIRGGSWNDFDFSSSIDSSFFERRDCENTYTSENIGFRVVRTVY